MWTYPIFNPADHKKIIGRLKLQHSLKNHFSAISFNVNKKGKKNTYFSTSGDGDRAEVGGSRGSGLSGGRGGASPPGDLVPRDSPRGGGRGGGSSSESELTLEEF